jgi:hypothetical protein
MKAWAATAALWSTDDRLSADALPSDAALSVSNSNGSVLLWRNRKSR